MTKRNLFTVVMLIASFMIASFAVAMARPLTPGNATPEPTPLDRKRRRTPSPATRPKPSMKPAKPAHRPRPNIRPAQPAQRP